MKLLILGLSSIVARRVLPAAGTVTGITSIDIASRSRDLPVDWPKRGRFYRDYGEALAASAAGIVYISLPNSSHVPWIKAALEAGRHVIVDKPATLTLEEAEACAAVASRRGCVLAEATVFSYHSQFAAMQTFVAEIGPLTHVSATFVIPPMPIDNFRNHRDLGGGCLYDMGPYAAAVARLFGGGEPHMLAAVGAPPAPDRDIDMGFSLLAGFANGVRYTGHFSFESEYRNRLTLIGHRGSLTVDRCFSLPAGEPSEWQVRRRNVPSTETQPGDDNFARFLEAVLAEIQSDGDQQLLGNMLRDARFRARLQHALQQGNPS